MTELQALPAKVEALALQISQLHGAMDIGFAALDSNLRDEIRAGDEETRRVLRAETRAGEEETRRRMLELHQMTLSALDRTIAASADGIRAELRSEIRAGDEETRRRMLELHGQTLAAIDRATAANEEALRRQLQPLLDRIRPNDETSQP